MKFGTMETLNIVSLYYKYSPNSQLNHQMIAPFSLYGNNIIIDPLLYATPSLSDACYILSFAIIMLNTSLHNPNVKHKVKERERDAYGFQWYCISVKLWKCNTVKLFYSYFSHFHLANSGAVYINESWHQWWQGPPCWHAKSELISLCLLYFPKVYYVLLCVCVCVMMIQNSKIVSTSVVLKT